MQCAGTSEKIRALLRLIQREIGPEIYRARTNVCAMWGAVSRARATPACNCKFLAQLRDEREQERMRFPRRPQRSKAEIADARGKLSASSGAKPRQSLQRDLRPARRLALGKYRQQRSLLRAAARSYRRGRKWFRCAGADPVAENFHSWRKRVKDLWYQSLILRDLNRTVVCRDRRGSQDAEPASWAICTIWRFLRHRLETSAACAEDERVVLLGLICARERELEQVALDLGARFYAEKPGAFGRRLLRYARQWSASPGAD